MFFESTIMCKNHRDNCEKRCCSGSHKQIKTLFKDHMVRLKIISLDIYKDLRLKILGQMSHVTIITRMATLCPVLGEVLVSKLLLSFEA